MQTKTKVLSAAVRLALSVGTAMALGAFGAAFAQDATSQAGSSNQPAQSASDKNVTELKTVVVTGSHIRRVDVETANPVISVARAAIEATGDVTLGDLVQDLPAMTGGATNPNVNAGGGQGETHLSLRGLGPTRTLILVDGHRIVSRDVNAIPAAMIERIDVLKDGASAIYGSDAIGGVVNFITKENYQGAQITANYGASDHNDGEKKGYTFTFGQTSDKGSIIGGVGYNQTDGVLQAARKFSENTLTLKGTPTSPPSAFVGGSSSSSFGDIQLPSSGPVHDAFAGCASSSLALNPGASGMDPIGDFHCYVNSGPNNDKYNFGTINFLLTPQARTNGFILGTYNLTSNVSVYLNAYYNKTRSSNQRAPSTYGAGNHAISANNFYNPFDIEYSSQGSRFQSRVTPLGNRNVDYATSMAQFSTGLKGLFSMFNQDWNWDLGMDYGHIGQTFVTRGLVNSNKLYTGPSFLDPATGQVTCGVLGSPVTGCDASFNPFNMYTASSIAALQNASTPAISDSYTQEKVWRAVVSGGLFDLPAGSVQLALGATYRQEHSTTLTAPLLTIDPSTGTCVLGSLCASNMQGGFNVKEAYSELFIPILSNLPWAYGLNVTVGDRYSRFSTFGSTNNKEFKVEWRPIQALLLRGTVAEVFRAPNIEELFGAAPGPGDFLSNDPCDHYTGSPVDPLCVNVPTDGSFINHAVATGTQGGGRFVGSKLAGFPIKPESGKSFDLGAVYSPPWLAGLSVSADVWHVYLNNIITSIGTQSLINLCSTGQTLYCQFVQRFPSGPQQGQIDGNLSMDPTGNLGSTSTGGVDLSAGYRLDTDTFGRFNFNLDATYLKYYTAQTAPGTTGNVTYNYAGHFMGIGSAQGSDCPGTSTCLFPRVRGNASILWNLGNWRASWKVRYVGAFRMGSPAPSQDTHPAGSKLDGFFIDYGSHIYHDMSVGYNVAPLHTRLDVGVNNLFDKQPPLLYQNALTNTDALNFDVMGRYYWARVTVSF